MWDKVGDSACLGSSIDRSLGARARDWKVENRVACRCGWAREIADGVACCRARYGGVRAAAGLARGDGEGACGQSSNDVSRASTGACGGNRADRGGCVSCVNSGDCRILGDSKSAECSQADENGGMHDDDGLLMSTLLVSKFDNASKKGQASDEGEIEVR